MSAASDRNELFEANQMLTRRVVDLVAENQRLREALVQGGIVVVDLLAEDEALAGEDG